MSFLSFIHPDSNIVQPLVKLLSASIQLGLVCVRVPKAVSYNFEFTISCLVKKNRIHGAFPPGRAAVDLRWYEPTESDHWSEVLTGK